MRKVQDAASESMTEADQETHRARAREHWEHTVVFNRHLGIVVQRWDPEAVELRLPFNDEWSASDGYLHGGAVATLDLLTPARARGAVAVCVLAACVS